MTPPTLSPDHPEIVAASFEQAALNYREHAQVQEAMAEWLGEWLPPQRMGRALEIGAGPGVFTQRLLPWHGELTATDLSPAMCAQGRTMLPQVDWRVMAAENPADGPWDWIFCSSMLQWARRPAELFATWREALAPGGRLLAGIFVQGSLPELRALHEAGPVTWRPVEAWRASLERGGLSLVRDTVEQRVFRYPSGVAFLRSLHGVGAAPKRMLSAGRLRRLLRDYELRHGGEDGVHATWKFYRCEAERT